jgi:hypothetical protein
MARDQQHTATAIDGSSAWDISSVMYIDGDDILHAPDMARARGNAVVPFMPSMQRQHPHDKHASDASRDPLRNYHLNTKLVEELEHKDVEILELRAKVARMASEVEQLKQMDRGGHGTGARMLTQTCRMYV